MNLLCCLYLSLQAVTLVAHDAPLPLDRPAVSNPYARVAIGYERDVVLGPFVLRGSVEAFHFSSIATGRDQGDDGLAVGGKLFFGRSVNR